MKILMVSPTPTHPTTAGNRARVLTLVTALQGLGHEVHFALATLADPDLTAMGALTGEGRLHVLQCRETYAIKGILPRLRRRLLTSAGIEAGYLWGLDDFYDAALTDQIRHLCTRHAFDAVFVEYVYMSKSFDAIPAGVVRILDTHDRFSLRHRTFLEAGQRPHWFSTTIADETRGLRRADYVLAIQEREADLFTGQLGAVGPRVITVGHLLDLHERVQPAAGSSAVFLASGNPINVEAAGYFIDQVLPLIRQRQPEFRLLLAGDVGESFRGAGSAVICMGRVAAVADAFRSAALSVNPVRMGTGLNIKMLEALACGAACVSSMSGSRGLELHRNVAFETVPDDDAPAMAQAVLSLLDDPQRAMQLGDRGRALAVQWNQAQLAGLGAILNTPH